jgi:hypothetical protein
MPHLAINHQPARREDNRSGCHGSAPNRQSRCTPAGLKTDQRSVTGAGPGPSAQVAAEMDGCGVNLGQLAGRAELGDRHATGVDFDGLGRADSLSNHDLLDPDPAGDVGPFDRCTGTSGSDDQASAAQRHLEQRTPLLRIGSLPSALPVLTARCRGAAVGMGRPAWHVRP